MDKKDKIEFILAITAGKKYQILQPRNGLNFIRHGHDNDLYIGQETGEIMTEAEIDAKYNCHRRTINGVGRITTIMIVETGKAGNPEVSKIWLLPIDKPELIIQK